MKKDAYYYFAEVAAFNSINIAATKLNMTQPALSMAIKKMETELGVKLLERSAGGVVLTPVGQKILKECKKIMKSIDAIEAISLKEQKPIEKKAKKEQKIKLFCTPAIEQTLWASFLHNLGKADIPYECVQESIRIETLSLMIQEFGPSVALLQISDEDYQQMQLPENIHHTIISTVKACVIVCPKHELTKKQVKDISFKEILAWPIIKFDINYGINDALFNKIRSIGSPQIAISTKNINVYQGAISTGMGIAMGIVGFNHKGFVDNNQMHFIPIRDNFKFHLVFCHTAIKDEDYLHSIRHCIL